MLVVDRDVLRPIDLLDLVDQVALQFLLSQDRQNVVGVDRAVDQGIARPHPLRLLDVDVRVPRDQIFAGLPVVAGDDDLPGDDGRVLGPTSLEELDNARQTPRDVLGLGRFARNLGQHVSRMDFLAVIDHEVRADRQQVLALTGLALDEHLRRTLLGSNRLDDDLLSQARDPVRLLAEVLALDDVAERDLAADLGQDGRREGIPLDQLLPRDDFLSVGHLDGRAVNDRVPLLLASLVVHDRDLAVAVDHDEVAVLAVHGRDIQELDGAWVLGLVLGLLGHARRGSAIVERPHRQLRAGLADRLRRDHADRLADLDHLARGQHAAVAEPADAALGLAGENRADLHALDARLLHAVGELFGDLLTD